MARQRSPDRDKAFEMWQDSDGTMKLKDIADSLGVSEGTVRGWKNKDKWDDQSSGTFQNEHGNAPKNTERSNKGGAPKGNKNAVGNKGGAPPGNKNAIGNEGGPGGPKRNDKAVTHGFFRKYLPAEVLPLVEDIMSKFDDGGPLDILWESIILKYTAIIHSQPVMFVKDHDDLTKELKKTKVEYDSMPKKDGEIERYETFREEEYELQFAWDKQAKYLNAQSRAMSELRGLIKDFLQLSGEDDMRRLQLEKIQQDIRVQAEKLAIEKERFEMEKKQYSGKNNEADDWAEAVKEIADRRRKLKGETDER